MKLAVVCYLYKGEGKYTSEHANVLRRMVARHLSVPHDFWCVGDDPAGLDPEVKFRECARELLPLGGCYVKLEMWRRDAGEIFGDRILLLDIDAVVCGSLDPIVGRTEDVVIWRDALSATNPEFIYNGSIILMTAGTRPEVWERFDPETSPAAVEASGIRLNEQAWIALTLGPDEAVFTRTDGVLSYKLDGVRTGGLPADARIVFFHGRPKPWEVDDEWVRRNWR